VLGVHDFVELPGNAGTSLSDPHVVTRVLVWKDGAMKRRKINHKYFDTKWSIGDKKTPQ
jgi:hypothetical protein